MGCFFLCFVVVIFEGGGQGFICCVFRKLRAPDLNPTTGEREGSEIGAVVMRQNNKKNRSWGSF